MLAPRPVHSNGSFKAWFEAELKIDVDVEGMLRICLYLFGGEKWIRQNQSHTP